MAKKQSRIKQDREISENRPGDEQGFDEIDRITNTSGEFIQDMSQNILEDRELIIKAEIRRIKTQLKGIPADKLALVQDLIHNAAFMATELRKLQDIISVKGCTEKYQNGENQSGEKESVHFKSYNAMIKTYAATIKQLTDLNKNKTAEATVTGKKKKERDDSLMGFIMNSPRLAK